MKYLRPGGNVDGGRKQLGIEIYVISCICKEKISNIFQVLRTRFYGLYMDKMED